MIALDKNLIMTGDLLHNSLTDGNGFVRLKRESFVLLSNTTPMTMKCVVDNRVIDSSNMGATIEFAMKFNFIQNKEDKRTNCIEMKSPEDQNDLTISINLLNWMGGMAVLGIATPMSVTNMIPLFNLSTTGKIFFMLTIRGCDSADGVFVDVDFWYGNPKTDVKESNSNESTESKEESVKS